MKIAPYFVVGLDGGPATAFVLRLVSTPRTKSAGTPVWRDFSRNGVPGTHVLGQNAACAKVNNRL